MIKFWLNCQRMKLGLDLNYILKKFGGVQNTFELGNKSDFTAGRTDQAHHMEILKCSAQSLWLVIHEPPVTQAKRAKLASF